MRDFFSGRSFLSMLGVAIGVLVAESCVNRLEMPFMGWFIGGCVIGLSTQIRFPVKRSKWYLAKVISRPILAGIAASVAYNLSDWLM